MRVQSFISRSGLIKNLHRSLLGGQSAVMAGGPMIGKTILARMLVKRVNQEDKLADDYRAVLVSFDKMACAADFWSLLMDAILHQGIAPHQKNPYRKLPDSLQKLMTQLHHIYEKLPQEAASRKLILVLDDCDRFLPDLIALISQIENMKAESMQPQIDAICWVGGLAWLDWVDEHRDTFMKPLRTYPLSVVPLREARSIIQNQLGPDQVERVWNETGGHPFLLEKVFSVKNDVSTEILKERIWNEIGREEEVVLDQLDPGGEWKLLEALKDKAGQPVAKRILDRLCILGIIVRTLDHGTAVVRKTSKQF